MEKSVYTKLDIGLHDYIKQRAALNNRSIQGEIRNILQEAREWDDTEVSLTPLGRMEAEVLAANNNASKP